MAGNPYFCYPAAIQARTVSVILTKHEPPVFNRGQIVHMMSRMRGPHDAGSFRRDFVKHHSLVFIRKAPVFMFSFHGLILERVKLRFRFLLPVLL